MSFVQGITSQPQQPPQVPGSTPETQAPRNPLLDPNGPFSNLNLTAQQQQQVQQIFSQTPSNSPPSPSQLFDQVESILTPQQQQTLQNDLETAKSHHHHHHGGGGGGGSANDPLSQLSLTSDQQNQISQILQSAQTNGSSPSDVLSQIEGVLSPSQQQQLVSLFSAYSSTGTATSSAQNQPYVINANA